jgi:UDP-N-acetylmuramyl pentapeptide phosphotransferase/UDP-N-acetylglucosamine-1-phosphate transferase
MPVMLRFVAALLAALAGFVAFNVIDGVFGLTEAILGLVASVAFTVFVVRRSPPPEETPDA